MKLRFRHAVIAWVAFEIVVGVLFYREAIKLARTISDNIYSVMGQ